jgi:hypothetical protein
MIGQGLKISFVLLCLLGTGGCSSTEDAVDPNATVSGFCTNWGKAACSSAVVLACSGGEKVTAGLTDDCVMSQRSFCEGLLPATGFNSQKASQCLSAVQNAYTDARLTALEIATVRHRGDPCNHLIRGPRREGESCVSDDDCDTLKNYLCVLKSGEGSCRIPTLVENGDSCEAPGAACNPGYYCGVDEACVKSKDVGKTCAADFECATGLACNPDDKVCTARVSAANCEKDDDCTTNVCDIPVGSSTGRCVSAITLAASTGICEDLR